MKTMALIAVTASFLVTMGVFAEDAHAPPGVTSTPDAAPAKPGAGAPTPSEKQAAAPVGPLDADALHEQALQLWHMKGDLNGAFATFNKAVEADPESIEIRLSRAHFLELTLGGASEENRPKLRDLAREDFQHIADKDPDGVAGGIARDGLTRLSGKAILPDHSISCPVAATESLTRAESLFGARHFLEAMTEYDKATESCPASAVMWISYADAYFMLKDYAKAKELYMRGLQAYPWERAGHRFLADAEAYLRDFDSALHEAELAVVSDPTYEAAWSSLRDYSKVLGRGWNRIYASKTVVSRSAVADANGKKITVTLPTPKAPSASTEGTKEDGGAQDVGTVTAPSPTGQAGKGAETAGSGGPAGEAALPGGSAKASSAVATGEAAPAGGSKMAGTAGKGAPPSPAGTAVTAGDATSTAEDADTLSWMAYGLFKAGVLFGTAGPNETGKVISRKVDPDTMSALEIERTCVKYTLKSLHDIAAKTPGKPSRFWSMMEQAERAGFLDEAIFLHMLDEPLGAEYFAFRDKNSERLVRYLDTMIVPKPGTQEKKQPPRESTKPPSKDAPAKDAPTKGAPSPANPN